MDIGLERSRLSFRTGRDCIVRNYQVPTDTLGWTLLIIQDKAGGVTTPHSLILNSTATYSRHYARKITSAAAACAACICIYHHAHENGRNRHA